MIESTRRQANFGVPRPALAEAFAGAGRAVRRCARPATLAMCVFLASLVRWLGVPSPFAAALLLCAPDGSSPFTLLGLGAGLALRLLWGVDADAWQYVGCLALWLALLRAKPREGIEVAALAGLAMMPRAVALLIARAAPLSALLGLAAVPVSMLAAVALRGAFSTLQNGLGGARERAGAYMLCLLMVGSLGYFRLPGLNLGQLAAALAALATAYASGAALGAVGGLLCGLALALIGHDSAVAFSLSLCGLVCGLLPKRRWMLALAALAVNLLSYLLSGRTAPPLSFAALASAGLLLLVLPEAALSRLRSLVSSRVSGAEGRFVYQRIGQLRQAVCSIAEALPAVDGPEPESSRELGALLCAQCANYEQCWGGGREQTEKMLAAVMAQNGDDAADCELVLRHGCLRSGAIRDYARDALAQRNQRARAQSRARFEREMTLTHLGAMSGTLAELELLSAGDTMSDLRAARAITQAIETLRLPLRLDYARRVDGHLQASLTAEGVPPLPKHLEALLLELAETEGLSLSIARARKGRVDLEEIPLYSAAVGVSSLCAQSEQACGDSSRIERCDGGRILLMLSDGMGHGERAQALSEKTLELLEKTLEAGYSRRQAITAVNGVMLGTQSDDGFATADLCDIDLWTGDVYTEKLGACPTWVVRGDHLKKLDGASLPIGVRENAAPTSAQYRLHSGDILVMTSDGVTDLFPDDDSMRRLIKQSLFIQPQRMADAILRNALLLSDGKPKDDMTALVALLMDRRRSGL